MKLADLQTMLGSRAGLGKQAAFTWSMLTAFMSLYQPDRRRDPCIRLQE